MIALCLCEARHFQPVVTQQACLRPLQRAACRQLNRQLSDPLAHMPCGRFTVLVRHTARVATSSDRSHVRSPESVSQQAVAESCLSVYAAGSVYGSRVWPRAITAHMCSHLGQAASSTTIGMQQTSTKKIRCAPAPHPNQGPVLHDVSRQHPLARSSTYGRQPQPFTMRGGAKT